MATWTVGELKENLDDYGDHIPVRVTVVRGENEKSFTDFEAETRNASGELFFEITVEQ